MTHNNSYEDSPAFVVSKLTKADGTIDVNAICADKECFVTCTCAAGWSDSASGEANEDYTSVTSKKAYAFTSTSQTGSLSSARSYSTSSPQYKTCYQTCTHTPSGSCSDGYSEGLTSSDCSSGYTYTSTTITRTYSSSPAGCSKDDETITCGKCELDQCPDGYFKKESEAHVVGFTYEDHPSRSDCEKVKGCDFFADYTTVDDGAGELGLYKTAHGVTCYRGIKAWRIGNLSAGADPNDPMTCKRTATCNIGPQVNNVTIKHTIGGKPVASSISADCRRNITFSSSELFWGGMVVGSPCVQPDSCAVELDGKLYYHGDIIGSLDGTLFDPNQTNRDSASYNKIACIVSNGCPPGYYEDVPDGNYFNYVFTSVGGKLCYAATGCKEGLYDDISSVNNGPAILHFSYHEKRCSKINWPTELKVKVYLPNRIDNVGFIPDSSTEVYLSNAQGQHLDSNFFIVGTEKKDNALLTTADTLFIKYSSGIVGPALGRFIEKSGGSGTYQFQLNTCYPPYDNCDAALLPNNNSSVFDALNGKVVTKISGQSENTEYINLYLKESATGKIKKVNLTINSTITGLWD